MKRIIIDLSITTHMLDCDCYSIYMFEDKFYIPYKYHMCFGKNDFGECVECSDLSNAIDIASDPLLMERMTLLNAFS